MEYKHFSHVHGLAYHQMPPGAEIQCSGCKFPGSGNVYSCWQCSYFLHENCFQATRSLKHPSHPNHPLTLVPYPTYPSNSFFCNTCHLAGNALSYSCSECEFDLHVHCAFPAPSFPPPPQITPEHYPATANHHNFNPQHQPAFPPSYYESTQVHHNNTMIPPQTTSYPPHGYPVSNQNGFHEPVPNLTPVAPESAPAGYPTGGQQAKPPPEAAAPVHIALLSNPVRVEEIRHFSHPHSLVVKELAPNSGKVCSGCEDDELEGTVYSCVDPQCNFNLHKSCFELPIEIRHKSHLDHPLKLLAKAPSHYEENQFGCNACLQNGAAFVYHCEECSFDLHVECVALPESIIRPDHKHPLKLFYSNPAPKKADEEGQDQVMFVCDVCRKPVHETAWIYSCHECEFGTHLTCAAFQAQPVQKTEEELVREAEFKMAMLNILMNGGLDPASLRKA